MNASSLSLLLPFLFSSFMTKVVAETVEKPDTCIIGLTTSCPTYYACYPTEEKPSGECLCWRYFGFTDDESGECRIMPIAWTADILLEFICIGSFLYTCYQTVLTMARLKKAGSLRNNTAGRMMIYIIFRCIFSIGHTASFVFVHFKVDKTLYGYYVIRIPILFMLLFSMYAVNLECVIAWLDLAEKSVKLSKSSSAKINIARKIIRLILISKCCISIYYYGSGQIRMGMLIQIFFFLSLSQITWISGYCINKVLIPDMKDKNHVNYKAAQAIKKTYIYQTVLIVIMVSLFGHLGKTLFELSLGNFSMYMGTALWPIFLSASTFQWLSYVQYGSRKVLENYEQSRFEKMLSKLTFCIEIERQPTLAVQNGNSSRKTSQVASELTSVDEDQA